MTHAIEAGRLASPDAKAIEDFAWVEPWLWRGGQPTTSGFRWLDGRGVKLVVNLRLHHEEHLLKQISGDLQPIHIAVKDRCPPTDEQALEWLALCDANKPSRPIFVHCKLGRGRTSLFCALVRIAQGWNIEDVIDEQRRLGFEPETKHQAEARFLRDFAGRVGAGILEVPDLS